VRFVVLEHFRGLSRTPDHWDFMFESPPRIGLRTWSLSRRPDDPDRIAARSLPIHRQVYLEYEGPVFRGGGCVRRWDAGIFRVLHESARGVRLALAGSRLRGIASLALDGREWEFTFRRYAAWQPAR
jgi:hypothetical protein